MEGTVTIPISEFKRLEADSKTLTEHGEPHNRLYLIAEQFFWGTQSTWPLYSCNTKDEALGKLVNELNDRKKENQELITNMRKLENQIQKLMNRSIMDRIKNTPTD